MTTCQSHDRWAATSSGLKGMRCSSIPGKDGMWEYHALSFKCPEEDCDYHCVRFNSFERHIARFHSVNTIQDYSPEDFIDYDTVTYGTQEECRRLARRKKLTDEIGESDEKLKDEKDEDSENCAREEEVNESDTEEKENKAQTEGEQEYEEKEHPDITEKEEGV